MIVTFMFGFCHFPSLSSMLHTWKVADTRPLCTGPPDFQGQASSITIIHSRSLSPFWCVLEKIEYLGVSRRSGFWSWYLPCLSFLHLCQIWLLLWRRLINMPPEALTTGIRLSEAWAQMDISYLHQISIPFQTFTLKCLMSQTRDFSVIFPEEVRPVYNSLATVAALIEEQNEVSSEKRWLFSPAVSGLPAWLSPRGTLCKNDWQNPWGRMLWS